MTDPKRWHFWPKVTRDGLLLALGALLLVRESLRGGQVQGELVTAGIALLLAPIPLRLDERRKSNGDAADDPEPP